MFSQTITGPLLSGAYAIAPLVPLDV